jgi:DNA-directed RNA polymerase specialized sigma24 family protein
VTSAGEAFVIELGRVSRRASSYLRGLQRADRDDVLAAAVLWCWENRDAFTAQLTTPEPMPLEKWFLTSVRRAKRAWRSGEIKGAHETLADIPVPDATAANAAVESAVRELVKTLTPEQRRIAIMQAKGRSVREIAEKLSVDIEKVRSTRGLLRKLLELLPGPHEVVRVLRTEPAPASDKPSVKIKPTIDAEIEAYGKPKLGGAVGFADDYTPHKRQYAPWEDIRGTFVHIRLGRNWGYSAVVRDYEGDGNARRLLLDTDGGPPTWMTANYTE